MATEMMRFSWSPHPVEWSVELNVAHTIPASELVDVTDDLLEALAPNSAAASSSAWTMTVRMTVNARSQSEALETATRCLAEAFVKIRRPKVVRSITSAEVETMEQLERRLQEPPLPEVVGVAELAEMLGVSKQRVSFLAHSQSGFPRPFATLAAGPVWLKPTLLRFAETWDRHQKGRPRKSRDTAAVPPTPRKTTFSGHR